MCPFSTDPPSIYQFLKIFIFDIMNIIIVFNVKSQYYHIFLYFLQDTH